MLFINLPVTDLAASRRFYTGLGFAINETFSDEYIHSVVISDTITVMVMEREKFASFITTSIANPRQTTQVLNALSAESREEVDSLMAKALANGGQDYREPQDEGPMYGRAFTDPDGHVWELVYMDMSQVG